jgi:2-haloalkanoic acid dehalogenase type II
MEQTTDGERPSATGRKRRHASLRYAACIMAWEARRIRVLSFDCYGTLIDWDSGIRGALATLPSLAGCDLDRLVREREQAELPLLGGRYQPYPSILAHSLRTAAAHQGREPTQDELGAFAASMARWPAFPDTGPALRRLASVHVLAILSNVESKTLLASVRQFAAPFAARITAEDVRSYKPAPRHWEELLKRLHQPREAVLHVAGSLHHDVNPARELGFATAWINRRAEPVPAELEPETVFPDLAALTATLLGA